MKGITERKLPLFDVMRMIASLKALIWPLDAKTFERRTSHVTVSKHGGLVKDPAYSMYVFVSLMRGCSTKVLMLRGSSSVSLIFVSLPGASGGSFIKKCWICLLKSISAGSGGKYFSGFSAGGGAGFVSHQTRTAKMTN